MEQLQPKDVTLDPEALEVESFTTTTPEPQQALMAAALPECTGCVSGCGIF